MSEIENRNPDPLTKNVVFMSVIDDVINATRANSVWPLTFGLACCAIEMMATGAAHYDL
ncbi:MAG: NADH-quinone oxidoreductase subunit B, partial [Planctomycetes bacterium]|nr:NADH-quinone oxidoreductase subunit B [Planctomycetota bacterium]